MKKFFKSTAAILLITIAFTSCKQNHVCDAYTNNDRINKYQQIKAATQQTATQQLNIDVLVIN